MFVTVAHAVLNYLPRHFTTKFEVCMAFLPLCSQDVVHFLSEHYVASFPRRFDLKIALLVLNDVAILS